MLLYIIYIEPLLILLSRHTSGLSFGSFSQDIEAYCDDVNIITDNDEDLLEIDSVVTAFESASGALLSRNKKCLVLGFGSWRNRHVWPLPYLKDVEEIKVFGIFIQKSYRVSLSRNWKYRYEKFEKLILSRHCISRFTFYVQRFSRKIKRCFTFFY